MSDLKLVRALGAKWRRITIILILVSIGYVMCVYACIYIYTVFKAREGNERKKIQREEERKGAKKGPVMIGSRPKKMRKQKRVHHPFDC